MKLNSLKNTSKKASTRKRVGRGLGSGLGKTSGRGVKGAGSRSGYRRRLGKEGGQFPLFMKTPIRGFSNARFRKPLHSINLEQIEKVFQDGDTVNEKSLREKGFISGKSHGVKLLGNGELSKKVTIEINSISEGAKQKLQNANITYSII